MPHIDGKVEGQRYIGPDNTFSVAITQNFWPRETRAGDQLFVDFYFRGDTVAISVFGFRYVEWLTLHGKISSEEFGRVAPNLVKEHVAQHFAKNGKFEVTESKQISAVEYPAFGFVATGVLNGKKTFWHGAVLDVNNGLAFLGQVEAESAIGAKEMAQVKTVDQLSASFINWLKSFHRDQ